jgi:5,10-methylenetetrahydrofolate reductase
MIGITIPIIPGVMPIQNFSSFRRLVKLTGCPVPDTIMKELEPISVSFLVIIIEVEADVSPMMLPSSDTVLNWQRLWSHALYPRA